MTDYALNNDLKVKIDDEQCAYFKEQPRVFLIESFEQCVFNISTEAVDSNKNASIFDYFENCHQIGYSLRVDDQYFYLCKDDETKIMKIARDNKMIISDLFKDETTKYLSESECETKYALKSDLNIYIQSQQDLAIIVGKYIANILTINSQISNLEKENTTLKTKLEALEARIAKLEWSSFYTGFIEEYQDANNVNIHIIQMMNRNIQK